MTTFLSLGLKPETRGNELRACIFLGREVAEKRLRGKDEGKLLVSNQINSQTSVGTRAFVLGRQRWRWERGSLSRALCLLAAYWLLRSPLSSPQLPAFPRPYPLPPKDTNP